MIPISPAGSPSLPNGLLDRVDVGKQADFAVQSGAVPASSQGAFDKAAETVSEVTATPVREAVGLGDHLRSGVQDLSLRLGNWQKSHAPTAPPASSAVPQGEAGLTASMQDAVRAMEGAYVFAIQATLASRGSTELTKVFNTLLKGQ